MSTDTTAPGTQRPASPASRSGWWRGRSELLVAALVIAIAAFIGVQTATMAVPPGTESPGPRFFPTLVTILMAGVGVALAVQVVLHPARPREADGTRDGEAGEAGDGTASEQAPGAPRTDWKTVATVVASLVVFIVALQPVGWILSAALLFFGVSYAMGNRRILFDITVSLVFSSFIQLAFVAGLGLNLPAGILGGIF
ncbi:putative tricarboxylic transport membrane protein [Spinactinospora alkalitolerans]|uniref:Putative tricarboxylic transport membrane protein n=1 Tax=Spinactinospora alkalitolerans TaxID=687207 RepID=A0A852TVB1_9ACTN|nr:tripartite tricarboxylate transporter TctB family protein [Spinactinospora alkalitolerans]NYE47335.1 putative tricarboxylic transport membrane protein [Spinactinospora alkalitolerans]